jgi:hypothetical protein
MQNVIACGSGALRSSTQRGTTGRDRGPLVAISPVCAQCILVAPVGIRTDMGDEALAVLTAGVAITTTSSSRVVAAWRWGNVPCVSPTRCEQSHRRNARVSVAVLNHLPGSPVYIDN